MQQAASETSGQMPHGTAHLQSLAAQTSTKRPSTEGRPSTGCNDVAAALGRDGYGPATARLDKKAFELKMGWPTSLLDDIRAHGLVTPREPAGAHTREGGNRCFLYDDMGADCSMLAVGLV